MYYCFMVPCLIVPMMVPVLFKYCSSSSLVSTTCAMDTYRECPEEVFENNLVLVPQETQNLITGDQWELYTDAVELCGMCPILRYRISVKFIKMLQVNLRFHRFMENLSPYFSETRDFLVIFRKK